MERLEMEEVCTGVLNHTGSLFVFYTCRMCNSQVLINYSCSLISHLGSFVLEHKSVKEICVVTRYLGKSIMTPTPI